MSSKAEKTSHHLYQHPRLSIFFRNPLLLKIVAWLGSLSFIGSTGVVWALKPISTSQAEAQALPNASASAEIVATERQIYGPYLPVTQIQSPIRFAPAQLPNREVPIAVAPASASISPTGKIVRPQHTDLLTADLYTVGVNSTTAEFVNLPVPAPLSKIIPSQTREIVTTTRSQIQPSYVAKESTVSQSAPATSIPPQATAASSNGHRVVPTVVSLPAAKSTSPIQSGFNSASTFDNFYSRNTIDWHQTDCHHTNEVPRNGNTHCPVRAKIDGHYHRRYHRHKLDRDFRTRSKNSAD